MENKEFSVSLICDQAWELAKKHGLILALLCLAIYIVRCAINEVYSPVSQEELMAVSQSHNITDMINVYGKVFANPMMLISYLVSTVMTIGLFGIILNLVRTYNQNQNVDTNNAIEAGMSTGLNFEACKMAPMTYLKVLAVSVITGILQFVGICCCILPGIFFGVRLLTAPLYMIENPDAGIGDALSASWNMTRGTFWPLLGLGFLMFLFCLLGVCCCCIGFFFAQAYANIALVVTYFALKKNL